MKIRTILLSLALLALAPEARAQQPQPPAPAGARWDVSGQLALLNRNKTDLGSRWDHWYAAPVVEGSAGHYWTPHLKTELEIATAGQGTIDSVEDAFVPGSTFPSQRYRAHKLRETTVGATAVYQFFDNQWVHAFLGAGVEVARERHLADSLPALRPFQAVPAIDRTSYSVRPVVSGGFKFYVNERVFVRTEVRTALSTRRPLAIQWRGGVGFDF